MSSTTELASNRQRRTEAIRLLEQARLILQDPDLFATESCIWRLVDAAGMVYCTLPPEKTQDLNGVTKPTGRGFRLEVE